MSTFPRSSVLSIGNRLLRRLKWSGDLSTFPRVGILSSGDRLLRRLKWSGEEQFSPVFALIYSNGDSSLLAKFEYVSQVREYSAVEISLPGSLSVMEQNSVSIVTVHDLTNEWLENMPSRVSSRLRSRSHQLLTMTCIVSEPTGNVSNCMMVGESWTGP